jgi:tetratricopeptide (TPR) repeat protein
MGALAEKGADLARAEKAYLAAVNAKPDRPESRVRLGLLYCRQKRYQDACRHLQKAAEAGQRTDSLLFHWGQALAETGDYAGALSVWRELHQRHPEDESLALNLSQLRYLVGRQHAEAERYEEAIVAWEAFLTSCPDDETLKRDIAELYFRLGLRDFATGSNHNRPRQALNSALALNGAHPFVPFYLALCDLVDGQSERAAERLSGFSADHPLYLRAIYHQGLAYLQMGQNARAMELLRAAATHPHRNNLNLPVELALAMTYVRSEQWEEALAVLKVQRP